jgi:hypothetical protein
MLLPFFNKECFKHNLIPNCVRFTSPKTSHSQDRTRKKIQTLRLKEEIKFWHIKKQHLNKQLYQVHLKLSNTWGNSWNLIEQSLNEKIRKDIDEKYQCINTKLEKLKRTQLKTPNTNVEFFSRIINNTNIDIPEEELSQKRNYPS